MVQIIYYLRSPALSSALQQLCSRSGLSCRAFQTADAGKTVFSLVQPGIPAKKTAGSTVPLLWQPPEFILMSGIQRPQMEVFLDACGRLGISQEVLKAMVTPVNAAWSVYTLLSQLQAEHKALKNR